ncbi:CelD/BcsL family acetyltransferase involved in cellulose biosynthesis [Streptacidiphilus sp. MAP12-20]|uniref:GNAT family N-acetyltransferase n=1 Tax=Streptacidiphilus sp. MAP12-20 TaxID=3156299 RepID=UPI0035174076
MKRTEVAGPGTREQTEGPGGAAWKSPGAPALLSPQGRSPLSVVRCTSLAELAELHLPWQELRQRCGSRNPYTSPTWVAAWAAHFTAKGRLDVLAVLRSGQLVGVAPCYVRALGPALRVVHLVGAGQHSALTELPQVLTETSQARLVLREVVRHWCSRSAEWDWLELPIGADQGWFEAEWLSGEIAAHGLVRHKTTRPSVVLPLPERVEELESTLKRNVRESIHRAHNRLERSGRAWTVTRHTGEGAVRRALPVLTRLHEARSQLPGRRRHPDVLGAAAHRAFLADALPRMAAESEAEILTLDVEGQAVAAELVLSAPRADYLAFSGVDPAWWHVSPVTLLVWQAARNATARGRAELNLSLGPDVAKLRWSERVVQHPEFAVCGPRMRSRAAYTGYAAAAAVASVHREAARHRVTGQ